MTFVVRATLDRGHLPEADDLRLLASDRLGTPVSLDPETAAGMREVPQGTTWCPWRRPAAAFFVPGATTRGVEIDLEPSGSALAVRLQVPALSTWQDWRLGLALAGEVADRAPRGVEVPQEGRFLAEGLLQQYGQRDGRWLAECEAGALAVGQEVRQGRVVRIGGPGGYASIGPRTWIDLERQADEPEDLALALVDRIQASIECRGFESFHRANPLRLDGPTGQVVLAAVLPVGQPTLLRDPQYVLLSDDLEADRAQLFLLPFSRLEDAFPARALWLDDRTAAVPAIPPEAWRREMERIRPLLVTVQELLDGA